MSPSPENWRSLEELYAAALNLTVSQRSAFLKESCPDEKLRGEVESLLAFAPQGDPLLKNSPWAQSETIGPGADLGPYRVGEKIGAGGMGEVYKARDARLEREVALKILPAYMMGDMERRARFIREARAASRLNHPNTVTVYDIGEQNGRVFIAMEYIDGKGLDALIPAAGLPVVDVLKYAIPIAAALAKAHASGIVHRDLKPGNVMIAKDGTVKVLDFGLAKLIEEPAQDGGASQLQTQPGMFMGTPAFMSPEQAEGKPVDARSDIFSFGAVLYHMTTGKCAFNGDSMRAVLAAVLHKDPEPLEASVPSDLQKIILRALKKDPERRFQTMADVRVCLEEVREQSATGQSPSIEFPAPPIPPPHVSRRPALLWMIATLAVTLIVTAGLLWRASRPIEHPLIRFDVDLGPDAIVGPNIPAAISGDGTRLAYLARGADGKTQLATRLLDQSQPTLLADTENASDPFFSPDGQWIGFFADGMMKKIPVRGGSIITLCAAAFSRGVSWGLDGNIIGTISTTGGMVRVPDSGGTPQPLPKANETGEIAHRWPQVLPRGEAVLFTAAITPGNYEDALINVMSLKTGQQKTVIRGGYFGRYLPSGHLVYIHEGTLFAVPFDTARLEVRGSPTPLLDDVGGNTTSGSGRFDFSTTGTFFFTSGYRPAVQYSVAWLDAAGTVEPLLAGPGSYLTPRLSPDGKLLALSGVPAAPNDLWLYDLQRAVLTRLTFTGQAHRYPVWTPDGKYIVFSAQSASGGGMWWMRADRAGQAKPLLQSKNVLWPASFSPDGRRLAFVQRTLETGFDIWTLPLDVSDPDNPTPGQPEPFLRTAADELAPAFSPDGHWIAYSSSEAGATQVYVRPFPGPGGIWQISTGSGTLPIWSPNGRELFYESRDNQIMATDYAPQGASFNVGRPRVWSSRPLWSTMFSPNLALSPDGKRFVIFPGQGPNIRPPQSAPAHLTVLLNFFDEVRRRVPGVGK